MQSQRSHYLSSASLLPFSNGSFDSGGLSAHADYKARVTVIGASYTGKTALVRRFVGSAAPKGYNPTIESLFRTNYCTNGVKYTVDVVDTAGSPELFEHLAPGYIESSDAFVCVYSALNPTSLDFARGALERIGVDKSQLGRTRHGTAVLLVCNMVEKGAAPRGSSDEKAAAAIVEGGKDLAKELMLPNIIVSALDVKGVHTAFGKIISRGAVRVEVPEIPSSGGARFSTLLAMGQNNLRLPTSQGTMARVRSLTGLAGGRMNASTTDLPTATAMETGDIHVPLSPPLRRTPIISIEEKKQRWYALKPQLTKWKQRRQNLS